MDPLNALEIWIGLDEMAIAVLINTASAPISIASQAWLGFPMPASMITGTSLLVDGGWTAK